MQRAKNSGPIGPLPTYILNPRPSLTEDEEGAIIDSENRQLYEEEEQEELSKKKTGLFTV
ncbi:hypothetical protein UFOVP1279_51 [uncultured Caudovirales phage]|uniref:Uncharacterized protein n=1 Tax=uncultured Caudovirales phage TaxID=2100421 RepID=A0A6J5RGJ1_9CAUD|nr:hypothetical protein UFOVP1279_51 [uncultured Caudovirales phage]